MAEDGPAEIPMARWPEVKVIDGARDLLAALAPSYALCVATNATISKRADIEAALSRGRLLEFISDVFCSTEIGTRKSSPEFWVHVTARLGCAAGEIAMLGDSLEQDVLGPANHGIYSIWFNPQSLEVPPGVRSVSRLEDFVSLIRSGAQ